MIVLCGPRIELLKRVCSQTDLSYAFTGASSTALLANFFIAFFVFFFSAFRFFS